jgi:ABC-type polysaccharide/polyol phosphate transport system ATPase subunit
MQPPAIRIEGLSKKYRVGGATAAGRTFYEVLSGALLRRPSHEETAEFWALRDIDLAIAAGEVLGIIGRNGAGKSTLLKVLARITAPTAGRVTIRGRVASLLEVGTGFHPELSGRENIYLNATILGMKRAEIDRKLDAIVDFSGIERFLDTPVKRYSSGMYVRLAFAVAAHVDADILLVDEVLAVGDAEFQKRCLGTMSDVARSGRTVIFVSHNLGAVEHFCQRGLYLQMGRVAEHGPIDRVVAAYSKSMALALSADGFALGNELVLRSTRFPTEAVGPREQMEFEVSFTAREECDIRELHIFVCDSSGERVALLDFRDPGVWGGTRHVAARSTVTYRARLKCLPLVEGIYRIGFTIGTSHEFREVNDVAELQVSMDRPHANLVPYTAEFKGSTVVDFDLQVSESRCE